MKFSTKTILLTFDYEVFLYRSGSPEKCMLEPTDKLLNLFKQNKIQSTFFVDVLYLWKLKQEGLNEIYNQIESQMRRMVAEGHRIELHLHPQWIEGDYQNGDWTFGALNYYRLQQLPKEKVPELFQIGLDILNGIAQKEDANYQVFSFRAGGLCIQPFAELKPIFEQYHLTVDSSVAPGFKRHNANLQYDFTKAPSKEFYHFDDEPAKEVKGGPFIQIPLSTFDRGISDKLFEKSNFATEGTTIYGDGQAVNMNDGGSNGLVHRLITKLKTHKQLYSFDLLNSPLMVKKLLEERPKLINVLSHPKLLSPYAFSEMERLFQASEDTQFLNIKSVADTINA